MPADYVITGRQATSSTPSCSPDLAPQLSALIRDPAQSSEHDMKARLEKEGYCAQCLYSRKGGAAMHAISRGIKWLMIQGERLWRSLKSTF